MKNKMNVILIVLLAILIGILIYVISNNNKNIVDNTVKEETYKYDLVRDYSTFFTIEECANKYFNYLSLNDNSSLDKIYDKDYINRNNVNNYVGKNISIRVNEMYVSNNVYYMKGNIYEELKNSVNKLNEEYLIIKVDNEFKLFSVIPISIEEYKEAINETI